jgi:hypothetical protein
MNTIARADALGSFKNKLPSLQHRDDALGGDGTARAR